MVEPLTKSKPLQSTNKSNNNNDASTSRGHVAYEDSHSSSYQSPNVRRVKNRSPAIRSNQNQPSPRGKTLPGGSVPTRHKRKFNVPEKNKALNEIRRSPNTTRNLIPLLTFGWLVREIMMNRSPHELRITPQALHALRYSAESYIVGLFEDVNRIVLNRNQLPVQVKDMQLAMYIRGHK
ncbi:unnamed protein product [Diamesa hyperborea]